jgi:hypothetical protein
MPVSCHPPLSIRILHCRRLPSSPKIESKLQRRMWHLTKVFCFLSLSSNKIDHLMYLYKDDLLRIIYTNYLYCIHSDMFFKTLGWPCPPGPTQPMSPLLPTSGRRSDCAATQQTPPFCSPPALLKWRPPPSSSISARSPYAPVLSIMEVAPFHLPNDKNE